MANYENEQVNTGIVNTGGRVTISNCAVGEGATIVNGRVVKGKTVNTGPDKDAKKK
ncbi:hypothetical protein [Nocardiopsis sp. NPDC055824]